MKAIYRTVLLVSAFLALFACEKKVVEEPEEPQKEEVQPETRTLTFVLPSEGEDGVFKSEWEAGDQIVVHGEYAKNQVTVTLAASDISADKKTATKTVEGLYPYKREDCTSVLYASWPASAVDNLKHCFFYSAFNNTNQPLLAACNSGDTFQFDNVVGALAFTVKGDFEGYLLATPEKEALGYEFLQVKITDREQNYLQFARSPLIQMEGGMSGSDVRIYMPAGTTFSKGFTLKLKKDGDYTKIYKSSESMAIAAGEVLELGDLSAGLQEYVNPFSSDILDLDGNGNANCYMLTQPGGYKFKAVYGNKSLQFLENVDHAAVLWETWNDDAEVTSGSVLASATYAEDYMIIRTPETLHAGNAVVAAYGENGEILWSWHIWVPATAVKTESYGGIMGNDVMDRNLGALVAAEASGSQVDPLSYGMVYQWGRKDPFTAAGSFNGSDPATCAGMQESVAQGQITLAESIANPRSMGHINNGDWADVPNNEYWIETEKTIYDPCPPGYRVPFMNGTFWSADLTAQAGWGIDATAGWITIGSPAAVFPIAGYRDDYGVGEMAKVGTRTLYWYARAGSDTAGAGADLRYDKGTYTFGKAPKARLGSVRCVAE